MPDSVKEAIRTTALVAFEHFDSLTEQQQEAVLITFIEAGTNAEAETASTQLFHKREARSAQLTLKSIIDGSAKEETEA